MFDVLRTSDMITIAVLLSVGSAIIGWIGDMILADLAYGPIGNSVLALAGACGGVALLDRALVAKRVPRFLLGEPNGLWIAAACLGAVLAILVPLLLQRITAR